MSDTRVLAEYEAPPRQEDCASRVIFFALLGWIGLIIIVQLAAKILTSDQPYAAVSRSNLILGAGQFILLGLLLTPLALGWRNPFYRPIFQTWALANGLILLLLPAYAVRPNSAQIQAGLHIALLALYIFILLFLARGRERQLTRQAEAETTPLNRSASPWAGLLAAGLVAVMVAYPWLALGALGSLLDTLLQLGVALMLGLAASLLIELFLLRPLDRQMRPQEPPYLLGGLSVGFTLMILASSLQFPFGGMQLLLLLTLGALGWALLGLRRVDKRHAFEPPSRRSWQPMAALAGLAAFAPLAFFDADELNLIIASQAGENMQWGLLAALLSALVGWSAGLLLALLARLRRANSPDSDPPRRPVMAILLAGLMPLALVGAAAIYVFAGQPGLFGDGMIIILAEQADLSAAPLIRDYGERRQYVYSTLVQFADLTQADIRQELERFNLDYTPYYLENAIVLDYNPLVRLWLAGRPGVDRILDIPRLRPLPRPLPVRTGEAAAPTETLWNLSLIRADQVWSELEVKGRGIVVGQADSGVQGDHLELAHNYRGRDGQNDYNWYDPWNGTRAPVDIGGHGTHTLGTIVGQTTGVAPEATWYACANLPRNLGNPALYLDCMQFMLAPFPLDGDPLRDGDPGRGAHVTNNSWGCPELEGCDPFTLGHAVAALRAAGVFVVASAGNEGPECYSLASPPALFDAAFTVGAINRAGELAGFSSLGPVTADHSGRIKPDILAPGVLVLSAVPGNTYTQFSGTSMAGPHIAGVVALMWSANPALIGDIDRTEQILIETAQPYQGPLPSCPGAQTIPSSAAGYGVVDAFRAVQLAMDEQ